MMADGCKYPRLCVYLLRTALTAPTPLLHRHNRNYSATYFLSPPFYFSILSVIFFFSALVSLLHYLGAVGFIVKRLGISLGLFMGTSPIESFNCIANMFLSMTEAPLLIKPALADATESELHAVMTAGFASVTGAILAAFISFGVSASDLLAATVMSAPAALAISKLVYPETKKNGVSNIIDFEMAPSEDTNIIGAAVSGASLAVHIVLEIGGQLIATIALVAMVDGFLVGIGSLIRNNNELPVLPSCVAHRRTPGGLPHRGFASRD